MLLFYCWHYVLKCIVLFLEHGICQAVEVASLEKCEAAQTTTGV